jgi:hypothetical protein
MPPSPPTTILPDFSEKQRQQIATSFYDASHSQSEPESEPRDKLSPADQAAFFDQGFYLPQRSPTRLVSAISVY